MDTEIRQAFGQRVRTLRQERGFSLRKFALTIGADKSYLVDIEYGRKSPTLDTIWRISSGLDVTMSYLLLGVETQHGACDGRRGAPSQAFQRLSRAGSAARGVGADTKAAIDRESKGLAQTLSS